MIKILEVKTIKTIEGFPECRHVDITISDGQNIYLWYVGGLPLDGDLQTILESRFDELWQAAEGNGIAPPDKLIYIYPIQAPAGYFTDIYVSSPFIKDDPDLALNEAIAEMEKGEGNPKSIVLIALSLAKATKHLREELKAAKEEIVKLKEKQK